jgi:hypothetical protein
MLYSKLAPLQTVELKICYTVNSMIAVMLHAVALYQAFFIRFTGKMTDLG